MLIFFLLGAVRFHTALFASEPEIVNKTTHVLNVIHSFIGSSIQPYQSSFGSSAGSRVRLFSAHLSPIAVFTPAQKVRTKGGNELEFDSIEPNKTGVNTPLNKKFSFTLNSQKRKFQK